jgi:DegV family protein with EDD domain
LAALELKEKYPERKVLVIDSLCASAGLGLLLSIAVDEKRKGKSIDEVYSYIESIKLNICHWFTVDDLVYLKRGGRVSPTVAFVGNMLGIKPILHVDNDGHLINVTKVRGRKASILALADKYTELALDKENGRVYISHAFCEADAKELSKIIEERHGVKAEVITDVGTVIGAHSGPGTLALFFLGKER